MTALVDLPDEVLLVILTGLDSARDVRALTLSCRRLHELVAHEGWRTFVRSKFPSLPIPSTSGDAWRRLAESLTWQTRCWEHRSLQFKALLPDSTAYAQRNARRRLPAIFQPVVDAHLCPERGEELLVWGAGENILARYRPRSLTGDSVKASWHLHEGHLAGYRPGYDDVRALAIVDRPHNGTRDILAGRDNGDLRLLSAQPDQFGGRLAHFDPCYAEGVVPGIQPGEDASQSTIMSLDVLDGLVAASTKESVILYRLPQDDDTASIASLEMYNLGARAFEPKNVTLGNARWMGDNELLAIALRGSKEPLQYLTLTPDGWSTSVAAKNADLEKRFDIGYGDICPNALQPVKPHANIRGGTSLLLSGWRDGSFRLQDLRTPSPFDLVYHDNISPWDTADSLITYGTERFVAGMLNEVAVKIFDFRWSKSYHHTSALPCGSLRPFPAPHQPFLAVPEDSTNRRACCDHLAGLRCRWHELSRSIYYRPNMSIYLGNGLPDHYRRSRVCSLAKASDVSPDFYIGISGGIIEASLGHADDSGEDEDGDGRACLPGLGEGTTSGPASCLYEESSVEASYMETGDGLASRRNHNAIRLPRIGPRYAGALGGDIDDTLRRQHRLESRYHTSLDFEGLTGGED